MTTKEDTSIRLSIKTRNRLNAHGVFKETQESIVLRLMDFWDAYHRPVQLPQVVTKESST
jgi:hypothetical protein